MRNLSEICSRRRSVRNYNMASISPEDMEKVRAFEKELEPLFPDIRYELVILEEEKVKGLFHVKAPHYICIYSEPKEGYLPNAGYLLEQMDLYLASIGLGACWLGVAKPPKEFSKERNGLEYVIMLCFGYPAEGEELYRKDLRMFKRKAFEEIVDIDETAGDLEKKMLETMRLAPSATNSQPWRVTASKGRMRICREKLSAIKAAMYSKMNQVDMGIAMCFLKQAAMAEGKAVRFEFGKEEGAKGLVYVGELILIS